MTDIIQISKSSPKLELNQERRKNYLKLALLANLAIWVPALLYLIIAPKTYTSSSAIALPDVRRSGNVDLPGIGKASYENSSPYSITSQDPRENYKFLALSDPILEEAAAHLNMSAQQFGEPRVKLLDNTSLIEIKIKGRTPQEAQNKSLAFYKVFEDKLAELRTREAIERDLGMKAALGDSQRKLAAAQKSLADYRASSGVVSAEQINELSNNIEQLRKERAQVMAQQKQANTRSNQLASNMNLSAQQANDAFALQSDRIFQQNLKDYSEANASITALSGKFLPNHPTIVSEKAKQYAAQRALTERSQAILGRPIDPRSLQNFNLGSNSYASAKENLFQDLVTAQAEQRGMTTQAQELDRQIAQLETRLKSMTKQEATLEELKRNMQVAEAVFSSNLTRLDINKSDNFGSYPLIQKVIEPSLPKKPSEPKTLFVLAGATLGSIFITAGMIAYWLRDRQTTLIYQSFKNREREIM